MLIKARFLIQPLEQEGGCQKCCISLCSKVFINHFYQMKASTECLNILIYLSTYWIDILRRTIRRKVYTGIFYQQIYRFCHYILHQVAHIDCSAPSGEQHEPLTGVGEIVEAFSHFPGILWEFEYEIATPFITIALLPADTLRNNNVIITSKRR